MARKTKLKFSFAEFSFSFTGNFRENRMLTHVYHLGRDGKWYWQISVFGDYQKFYQALGHRTYMSEQPGRCVL
jgi:hypothetical protein